MMRREFGSNASRRCMVQRLSHMTRSPTRQACSHANSGRSTKLQSSSSSARISKLKSDQIGIAATAQIEHASVGVRVRAYQRMHCTGGGKRIISCRDALTDIAAAVVSAVVLNPEPGNAVLQFAQQCVIDGVHAAERCVASL